MKNRSPLLYAHSSGSFCHRKSNSPCYKASQKALLSKHYYTLTVLFISNAVACRECSIFMSVPLHRAVKFLHQKSRVPQDLYQTCASTNYLVCGILALSTNTSISTQLAMGVRASSPMGNHHLVLSRNPRRKKAAFPSLYNLFLLIKQELISHFEIIWPRISDITEKPMSWTAESWVIWLRNQSPNVTPPCTHMLFSFYFTQR